MLIRDTGIVSYSINENGSFLTGDNCVKKVRHILDRTGIEAYYYSGHSFPI